MIEDTLVILKPDAISRGLVGNIFDRLEKVGLKMVACKMTIANKKALDKMYNIDNEQWVEGLGNKTIDTLKEFGLESKLKEKDPLKIGYEVVNKLKEYMLMGPVIVTVWEGIQAIKVARKIRGTTTPLTADIASINGSLSHDSQIATAFNGSRSLRNIAHTSGSVKEANFEIEIWFGKDFKPMDYDRTDQIFFI